ESEAVIRTSLHAGSRRPKYVPIVIKRGLDWETLARLEARLQFLPGVFVEVTPGRRYPYGNVAPHLLGYLGEISLKELSSNQFPNAHAGDMVGKYGVEARHETELAGRKGHRQLEVDAGGRLIRVVGEELPIPGSDLYLTIDLDLQLAAEEAMADTVGALVALEPDTGRIMAMVSSPSFYPDMFARGITPEEWEQLNDPVTRPLHNKVLQGSYPPGSTFKIVMAAAGLQERVIDESTIFSCTGRFRLGRRSFRCWDWRGHGKTNLYKALVQSCDVYFYQLGLELGVEKIVQYSWDFGLGKTTGIDLPDENPGFIATKAWKVRRFREPWQKGETLNISIGQGFTKATPLQMARLTAAVANGGTLYRPIYMEKITGPFRKTVVSVERDPMAGLPIRPGCLKLIRKALTGVVNDKMGTGKKCRLPDIKVAGKTGTAQIVQQAKRRQDEKMAWKFKDHAWFVAYAPAEKPQLAIAVLIEHGGHGGSAAAPIARKIFERWFQIQAPRPALTPHRSTSLKPEDTGVGTPYRRHENVPQGRFIPRYAALEPDHV
ncbi:MAG TPA: penicillin-binding protein 2, partial [Thermodesulfobacteriaceae bacterium]|nr:penicillin-binding protein 2 [Thermodesulfobacteriaceae bacterium]